MFIISIAASVSRRKSFSLIWSSPRSSRWALITIRRYLDTVTPGIATGYWKAMNSPIRARSSGAASVMSSPRKVIEPSVISSPGWPMIALASVDFPDPLGPIRAWIWPFATSRSSPLRISLPSAVTCRFLISRSANSAPVVGPGLGGGPGHGPFAVVLVRELDELGERRPGERLGDAALDARPKHLGRAGAARVALVRAQDLPLAC